MWRAQDKRLLSLAGLTLTSAVVIFVIGTTPSTRVRKTRDGWTCLGNGIQYEVRAVQPRPVVSGRNLIFVERFKKRVRLIERFKKRKMGVASKVTARNLHTGKLVFSTNVMYQGMPVQIYGIWDWEGSVVVHGFIQKTQRAPMSFGIQYVITVLNHNGGVGIQFAIPFALKTKTVDRKHGMVFTCQDRSRKDRDNPLVPDIVVGYSLRLGKEVLRKELEPFISDMIADGDGHIYLLKTSRRNVQGKKPAFSIEKYLIAPWKKLWSTDIAPKVGDPAHLKLEDKRIWYSVYHRDWGEMPDEYTKWIGGPLDTKTGAEIETTETCDPSRITAMVDGIHYVITKEDMAIHVRRVDATEN